MTTTNLAASILSGEHDDDLDAIEDALIVRRKRVAEALNIGTRVALSDSVKPKYLAGITGTLVDRRTKRGGNVTFVMEVDENLRAKAGDRFLSPEGTISGPASLFRAIAA